MSAVVIPLPGATALPVVQPQRRGRFPAGVVSLWRWRSDTRIRHSEADALEAKARGLREWVKSGLLHRELALHEAEELEALARTLRQRR